MPGKATETTTQHEWNNSADPFSMLYSEIKRIRESQHEIRSLLQTQQLEFYKQIAEHKEEAAKEITSLRLEIQALKIKVATTTGLIAFLVPCAFEVIKLAIHK